MSWYRIRVERDLTRTRTLRNQTRYNRAHREAVVTAIQNVAAFDPGQSAIKLVSEAAIRKHNVLPLYKRGNRLFLGIADPANSQALDEIKFQTNFAIEPILVDEDRLRRAIDQWLEASDNLADTVGADQDGL